LELSDFSNVQLVTVVYLKRDIGDDEEEDEEEDEEKGKGSKVRMGDN